MHRANINPIRYAGYRYDNETGLYYLLARYYDPATYRFLTKDPDGGDKDRPLSQNPYGYGEGDPVNNVDPEGEWIAFVAIGLLIITGVFILYGPLAAIWDMTSGRKKNNKNKIRPRMNNKNNFISAEMGATINGGQPAGNGPNKNPFLLPYLMVQGYNTVTLSPPQDPTFKQEREQFQPKALPQPRPIPRR